MLVIRRLKEGHHREIRRFDCGSKDRLVRHFMAIDYEPSIRGEGAVRSRLYIGVGVGATGTGQDSERYSTEPLQSVRIVSFYEPRKIAVLKLEQGVSAWTYTEKA